MILRPQKSAQPIRLGRQPIKEALCEIRFKTADPGVSTLLPGLLYQKLRDKYPKVENSQISHIPRSLRENSPDLAYQTLIKMTGKDGVLQIGDRHISYASVAEYPGWPQLKKGLMEAWEIVFGVTTSLSAFR